MRIPLKSLKILALDFQTTGNSPEYNHLLQIDWITCDGQRILKATPPVPAAFVIHQPAENHLSARIHKLTGIGTDDFRRAVHVETALDALRKKAAAVASHNRLAACPTVIHYARFELGFLTRLNARRPDAMAPVLDVICTHQLASLLLPQLPRKGIRAVAGYLGHGTPVLKRCASCRTKGSRASDWQPTPLWALLNCGYC